MTRVVRFSPSSVPDQRVKHILSKEKKGEQDPTLPETIVRFDSNRSARRESTYMVSDKAGNLLPHTDIQISEGLVHTLGSVHTLVIPHPWTSAHPCNVAHLDQCTLL